MGWALAGGCVEELEQGDRVREPRRSVEPGQASPWWGGKGLGVQAPSRARVQPTALKVLRPWLARRPRAQRHGTAMDVPSQAGVSQPGLCCRTGGGGFGGVPKAWSPASLPGSDAASS